jgi:hypothetical protein
VRIETPDDRKRRESIQATIAALSHAGERRPGGPLMGPPYAAAEDVNAAFARRKEQADAIHYKLAVKVARLERLMIRLMPLMPTIAIRGLEPELEDRPLTDWPSTPPEAER